MSVAWECVRVEFESEPGATDWAVKKRVNCVVVEVKLLEPQEVVGVRIGSFVRCRFFLI